MPAQSTYAAHNNQAARKWTLTYELNPSGLEYPIVFDPQWVFGAAFPSEAIVALNSVRLKSKSHVIGDVAVVDASPGPVLGKAELELEKDATVTGNVFADTIDLAKNALVEGDAFYNTIKGDGAVQGTETSPLSLPLDIEAPAFPDFDAGTDDVTVDKSDTATLAAGSYDDLKVKGGKVTGGTVSYAASTATDSSARVGSISRRWGAEDALRSGATPATTWAGIGITSSGKTVARKVPQATIVAYLEQSSRVAGRSAAFAGCPAAAQADALNPWIAP